MTEDCNGCLRCSEFGHEWFCRAADEGWEAELGTQQMPLCPKQTSSHSYRNRADCALGVRGHEILVTGSVLAPIRWSERSMAFRIC